MPTSKGPRYFHQHNVHWPVPLWERLLTASEGKPLPFIIRAVEQALQAHERATQRQAGRALHPPKGDGS